MQIHLLHHPCLHSQVPHRAATGRPVGPQSPGGVVGTPLVLLGAESTTVLGASTTDPTESYFSCSCANIHHSPMAQLCLLTYGLFQRLCQTLWQLQGFPHPAGPCMGHGATLAWAIPTGPRLRRGGSGCTRAQAKLFENLSYYLSSGFF